MSMPVSPAPVRRWPLALIACPAAVAIWSGWVGLGGLCGFGPIHPLPGIADSFTINTAITLPVGVEAYGAYALRAWLTSAAPARAQDFARISAIGALALGMCGQVIYHLLSAVHATRAPWPVVVLVSCIPVATLGMAAALTHMLGDDPAGEPLPRLMLGDDPAGEPLPRLIPAAASSAAWIATDPALAAPANGPDGQLAAPGPAPAGPGRRDGIRPQDLGHARPGPVTYEDVEAHYAAELAAGRVPSGKDIRRVFLVGSDRAGQFRARLAAAAARAADRRGMPAPVPEAS
ncbi:MAG: hypothetical protein ACRDPD_21740 [Streptosporangiaceae bacterium]